MKPPRAIGEPDERGNDHNAPTTHHTHLPMGRTTLTICSYACALVPTRASH